MVKVTTDDANGERSTHIEVCARLRPLDVNDASSSSFFEPPTPPKRKATLPRLRTPLRVGSRKLPSTSSTASTTTTKNSFYAWDLIGEDSITQSERTELVQGRTHTYTLDRLYGPSSTTEEVYQHSIVDLVHAAMDGYHTSVLAYGQTSTGKTHTMSGTKEQPGLIPLSIRECFDYLRNQEDPREYLLRVSYLEVYKEHIRDLLAKSPSAPPVRLFESAENGLVIKGLEEVVVTSPEQVFQTLSEGEARRQVGATHLNAHSSRSHVIVRLWIESKDPSSDKVRISSLSLVDLAGSESVRLTGSSERRQEGHYINQSLMTLGKVVYALSEDGDVKNKHIPYRDSKLTRLLQPSLSGNAQIVLLCCISPLPSHIEESHNTFKFATRAKKIPQKATINETLDEKTLLQSYKEEIEELRRQLKDAREQQERLMKSTSHSTASVSSNDMVDEDEIAELVKSIAEMEKLILKSRSLAPDTPVRPEDLLDASETDDFGLDDEEDLLAMTVTGDAASVATTPTRQRDADKGLQEQLNRIRGLLGSVMKKRNGVHHEREEVRTLRAQLEHQETASALRKADSSFLQQQLEQKDALLKEVSKLLEQMEERQIKLEEENAALRKELASYMYNK